MNKIITLDDKIEAAHRRGILYVPSFDEWISATAVQRKYMTWPQSVIAKISRERP